jgi:ribonuclease R
VGERVLAKLRFLGEEGYEGKVIRRLGAGPRQVLGIYERGTRGGRLKPTDKRAKSDYILRSADSMGAEPGELVLAEVKPHHPRLGEKEAKVIERLGGLDNHRALSLIAIHEHGLPTEFPDKVLAEAESAGPATLDSRADLRDLPLVTIDGADARDFDDAVFAEPDSQSAGPGGWHLVVAIADVAHYVRPDSALDRAAYSRGNSAYFPDRVVPMLPEALSNGWCSLRPDEERGCLAAHLWIDAEGEIRRHRFERGLMRSAARLTYEQVQAARDGDPDETARPLLERVIAPLYGAFDSLLLAREKRGTLDLDIPERRVLMSEAGQILGIELRQRLDSHRLIEEFMIAANVAAARELERLRQPCMYRVHDVPDKARVDALRDVLDGIGVRLAKGQVMRPKIFTQVLAQVAGGDHAALVSELVLRAQSQAVYSPENLGHFGLALPRYAHFTSPIRRYADLLVHRSLIRGLKLGPGGLTGGQEEKFEEIGQHISDTERRAAAAERDAVNRLTAAFLKDRVGADFVGRVNGVTRFGLFVTLEDTGADGLIPISTLPEDYYLHDEASHSLVGRRWGREYRLGQSLRVILNEADPLTGGIVLNLRDPDGEEPMTREKSLRAGDRRTSGPMGKRGARASRKPASRKGRKGTRRKS